MSSVKTILPDASVYERVEELGLPFDGQTFPSALSPVFDQLVSKVGAKVVIEVGSHKGGSAVRWAEAMGQRASCIAWTLGWTLLKPS